MRPIEFADRYLRPYRLVGAEINARDCPFCGSTKDKYKFYMNRETGAYCCHRGKCGAKGGYEDLKLKFGESAVSYKAAHNSKPKINPVTSVVEEYLALRKISKETIAKRQLGESNGNIVFPYYDEKGKLCLIKYRPARKVKKGELKAWREPGGKAILWGMNLCNPSSPLVITEGEIDSCSLTEVGIPNAVSVPSGASDFTWVDNCWDWLQKYEKIIIFGDNDEPGKKMVAELVKKLGDERCYIVSCDRKDANELLYYDGSEAVRKAVEEAKAAPVEGLIDLSDIVPKDPLEIPRIKSNINRLDAAIGGFHFGELSVWTGKRGEGKSTFLGQMLLEAVNAGIAVCAYSGELTAIRFQDWIHKQAAGSRHVVSKVDPETAKSYYTLPKDIHDKIREWYKGKFFLYDNTVNFGNVDENSIIRMFTYAAKRYNCKMFLVDNLMTAPMHETQERNYYRRQGLFVGELVSFAKSFNVHVHLVAHPRKGQAEDENDMVSGTSEITDRADNVFYIKRIYDGQDDAVLKITKNRSEGIQNRSIGLVFDPASKRFYQLSNPEGKEWMYGWEKPEAPAERFGEIAPWDEDDYDA